MSIASGPRCSKGYTPRPGCFCCDIPNHQVKQIDRRAWRRAGKNELRRELIEL